MSADPNVYEGTDVLRNTADIRDPQALAEREQIVSFRAMLQMQKEPVLGTFDPAHYASIQKRQPLDQGLINRVPSETRDALVLATRGKIRPLAEMVQNARYSEEMRTHPVLGRLSADAVEALRLMGAPRIVLPEPGTQVRGQVIATSYHHVLIRDSRQVSAVPLHAFHTMPRNNDRVDVRVQPEGRRPEPVQSREEVRAQITGRVLIPASLLALNGQRPEEVGRNAIEIPGPSEALSEALKTRSPQEIAADPRLAAEVRLIDRSLIDRFGHEGSGVLIEGLPSEAGKLLPQGQSLDEIREVLRPLLKAVVADDMLQTSLAQQQTLGRSEPSLGRSA